MLHPSSQHTYSARMKLFAILVFLSLFGLGVTPATYAISDYELRLIGDPIKLNTAFGYSISMDDDLMVVGAPLDPTQGMNAGTVYVYRRIDAGWQEEARLVGLDTNAYDRFGWSVSACHGWIAVGAWGDTPNGPSSGSVYLFHQVHGQWQQHAKLTASDGDAFDRFGWSVALDLPHVVVGAFGESDNGMSAGAAYVFNLDGDTWIQQQKVTPSDPGVFEQFGYAVAINGPRIAVGAPLASDNGFGAGMAYVFEQRGAEWYQQARLEAPRPGMDDRFGQSVALFGDKLLVGAPQNDIAGQNAGAVYGFAMHGNAWDTGITIAPETPTGQAQFGAALGMYANRAIVGAPGNTEGTVIGSTHFFTMQANQWNEEEVFTARSVGMKTLMGSTVAINSTTLLSGAWAETTDGQATGAVYLFDTHK